MPAIVNKNIVNKLEHSAYQEKSWTDRVWQKIIHERYIYLFFFTIGGAVTLIITLFFTGQSLMIVKEIEIALLSTAVVIKTFEVLKILNVK